MEVLQRVLNRLRLTLNEQKPRTVDARAELFDFVGFRFQPRRG